MRRSVQAPTVRLYAACPEAAAVLGAEPDLFSIPAQLAGLIDLNTQATTYRHMLHRCTMVRARFVV